MRAPPQWTTSSTSSSAAASTSLASTTSWCAAGARNEYATRPASSLKVAGMHAAASPHKAEALGVTVGTGRLPAEGVRAMFDRIAPVYDAMNRVMTVGLDGRWRAETAAAVVRPGNRVL